MQRSAPGGLLSVLLLVAIVLVANAPLLDDFARLLTRHQVAVSSNDAATHYMRMLHARDLYLPSGHRLGWEPFWFQGYVPFVLYPHLTYLLLAAVSLAVPVDPARIFNVYTVLLYFALPLVASLAVLRATGWAAAAVVAAWFSVTTATGAGLNAVFQIGLLSQQAGVILFTALAYDLIVAHRLDRAAVWLGLIPLVHVHTSLIAAVAWIVAGALAVLHAGSRKDVLRDWMTGSTLAALIGLPTLLGFLQGSEQVGSSTYFTPVDSLSTWLLEGRILAPWPAVAAMGLSLATAAAVVPAAGRLRFVAWFLLAVLLLAVSFLRIETGMPSIDRVFQSMLYLRTAPYAFVAIALLSAAEWPRFPAAVRFVVAAFTLAGITSAWPAQQPVADRIGTSWRGVWTGSAVDLADYRGTLDWIASDAKGETATLAVSLPGNRLSFALAEAVERTRLPLLGGHGVELTSVRNTDLMYRSLAMPCESIQRHVRDHAVGYLAGADAGQRAHLETCLVAAPAFTRGDWWVFATGMRWARISPTTYGFSHDATWTELSWPLRAKRGVTRLRLPIANSAPWEADVDGSPVVIESTADQMMRVETPEGGKVLRLRYQGYAGEWASVAVAIPALAFAVWRARRRRGQ